MNRIFTKAREVIGIQYTQDLATRMNVNKSMGYWDSYKKSLPIELRKAIIAILPTNIGCNIQVRSTFSNGFKFHEVKFNDWIVLNRHEVMVFDDDTFSKLFTTIRED